MSERDFLLFGGCFESNVQAQGYFNVDWSLDEPTCAFFEELGVFVDEDFCELHDSSITVEKEIELTYPKFVLKAGVLAEFTHYFLLGRYAVKEFNRLKDTITAAQDFRHCQYIWVG